MGSGYHDQFSYFTDKDGEMERESGTFHIVGQSRGGEALGSSSG